MALRKGKYLGQFYQQWRIFTSPYLDKSRLLLARYQMHSDRIVKQVHSKAFQDLLNSVKNESGKVAQDVRARLQQQSFLRSYMVPYRGSAETLRSNLKIYQRVVDGRLRLLQKHYQRIESSAIMMGRRVMVSPPVRRIAYKLRFIQRNDLYLKGRRILQNSRYPATYSILAVNSGVFLLWQLSGPQRMNLYTGKMENQSLISSRFMWRHFTTNWSDIRNGRLHTVVTTNFSHNKFGHFFFNMFALYFFGMTFESFFGPSAFLLSYMISGILASLVQSSFLKREGQPLTPILGASGAVNGLLMMVTLKAPLLTVYLYGILPFPLVAVVGGIFCFELFASRRIQDTTAHEGHLAGMLSGALLYFLKYR
ncbi:hypothetical protein IE077_001117 [Cardiosporidium cionae]|uniref:Peptidase S54 rhomboid domain-containing protein n=1 Tax=Cardiosporidium cionae TaxID=476202 RepID=A0ABQ7JDL8_9APIC|nr:hypothetical protein IE077_001117 [Cardiosporidium cionae]|eukprot:KAF8822071.1 hypothetical protein IE077_001117 [Cardiosporidium cionae]